MSGKGVKAHLLFPPHLEIPDLSIKGTACVGWTDLRTVNMKMAHSLERVRLCICQPLLFKANKLTNNFNLKKTLTTHTVLICLLVTDLSAEQSPHLSPGLSDTHKCMVVYVRFLQS